MRESHPTAVSADRLAPVQRIRPGPRILRLVKPIAGPDEVVGGDGIVGGIGHDATPSIVSRARFQRPHQPQLQGVAAVPFQHTDPAEIPSVERACRRHQSGNDGGGLVKGEPPMAVIKLRNGRAVKKCQAVKVGKGIGDIVVVCVDLTNPVHRDITSGIAALSRFLCRKCLLRAPRLPRPPRHIGRRPS